MPETDPSRGFMEHTEELASRFKVVFITFMISTITMLVIPGDTSFFADPFNFYEPFVAVVLRSLREQILPKDVTLIGLQLTAPIELYVIAAVVFGVAITMPIFAYEVFRFVDPALTPAEKRDVYPFVAAVSGLFVVGALFALMILVPVFIWSIFPFFTAVGAARVISVMDFYNVVFITTIAIGLVFTFPAFFVILVKYGIIGTAILRKNRKYVYLALFILAMIITPGSSPQSNLILFLPLLLLVEIGIFFGHRYEKKEKVRHVRWFWQEPKCKFCRARLSNDPFCPECGRAQS